MTAILELRKLNLRNNLAPLLGNNFILLLQLSQQSSPASRDLFLTALDQVTFELSKPVRQRLALRPRQRNKGVCYTSLTFSRLVCLLDLLCSSFCSQHAMVVVALEASSHSARE